MTAWLLTWLWQGMALAVGVSMAFRFLPRVNASTRYLIWWGAFAALVWLGWTSSPNMGAPSMSFAGGPGRDVPARSPLLEVAPLPQWLIASIFTLWATIALFKLLKILPGLRGLSRLKDSCSPISGTLEEELPLWRETRTTGRPVRLMICDALPSAAVLGLRRPYIACPSLLLEMVSAAEFDQILLHEYAHVQRRDDWTRLAQALLEAVFWMHPAARWIGSQLNLEREVACDDWVVSRTGAARTYAGCLSRVAENQRAPAPVLAPALFGRSPVLLRRVDRLLNVKRNATRKLSLAAASAGICVVAISAAHLRAFPIVSSSIVHRVPAEAPSAKAGPSSIGDRLPAVAATAAEAGPVVLSSRPGRSLYRQSPDIDRQSSGDGASAITAGRPVSPAGLPLSTMDDGRSTIDEPVTVVDSRSFYAIYPQQKQPAARSEKDITNGWQIAGVTIGKATRKASVAVAGSFSKAGVSIANSF